MCTKFGGFYASALCKSSVLLRSMSASMLQQAETLHSLTSSESSFQVNLMAVKEDWQPWRQRVWSSCCSCNEYNPNIPDLVLHFLRCSSNTLTFLPGRSFQPSVSGAEQPRSVLTKHLVLCSPRWRSDGGFKWKDLFLTLATWSCSRQGLEIEARMSYVCVSSAEKLHSSTGWLKWGPGRAGLIVTVPGGAMSWLK